MAGVDAAAGPPPSQVVMEFTRNKFPKDFTFGVATSAYQVEGFYARGGKGHSIWDVFTNGYPKNILDGSNGNEAVRMYDRYKEDIKTMRIMGFDAYRFSISWPRIIPGGKLSLGVNQEGVDYYNDLINTVIENGMKPYVTLFHWDLPYLLEKEYGGFLSDKIVDDFRDFAELCFWEFGDRVKHWITTNEAWTYAVHGYANRTFPPGHGYFGPDTEPKGKTANIDTEPLTTADLGQNFIPYRGVRVAKEAKVVLNNELVVIRKLALPRKTNDPEKAKEAYTVARNLLLCHAAAVASYRNRFQKLQKGKIGMTNNIHWFEPYNDTEEDRRAARRGFDFMGGWFLEPILTGQFPKSMLEYAGKHITPFSREESELLRGSCDFLGINYYTTMYATHDPHPDSKVDDGYNRDQKIKYLYVKNGKYIGESTGSSWLYIVPWGIRKLLKHINDTFKTTGKHLPPIYITENGCDQQNDPMQTPFEACKDTQRVKYFYDHLKYLHQVIKEDNIKVEAYFAWSFCDNFEWHDGYNSRFGILYIDYKNDLRRYRKDSAMWFTKFLLKDDNNDRVASDA